MKQNDMETITLNAEEWQSLLLKIDRIDTFVRQLREHLPVDGNAWLNEKEVCRYLNISPRTLQRLRKSGDMSFSTIASKHFYKASSIWELMEKKSVKSGKEKVEALRSSHQKRFAHSL
jgi:AraC-like DNA-binding protein